MNKIVIGRPIVSVIIDSYNFAHFLEAAVDSVLEQTVSGNDIEVILVDDGSTDDTQEKVKKYKDKIKYIYKTNGGQGSAINTGFESSSGEILFILDSDDIFDSDKIRRVLEIYDKQNCQAVFNSLIAFGDGVVPHKGIAADYNLQFLDNIDKNLYRMSYDDSKGSFLFLSETSGESFTRELFQKLYPIPDFYRFSADLYLHVFALLYEDIYYLDEPLTKYRHHTRSYMGKNYDGDLNHKISEIDYILDTINILEKAHNVRALPLIKSLQNKVLYLRFHLEKIKGNKLEALAYLLKYRASPQTFKRRAAVKARYMLDIILSENSYKSLRSIYQAFK